MRFIDTLVWHYTATYADQDIGVKEIDAMHKARGWSGIGYHYVVRLDGTVEIGRPVENIGAHVLNQNTGKIGCVTVGGLRRSSGPYIGVDTRTDPQKVSQEKLTRDLLRRFPTITKICGHRDLAATQCPAYDVKAWWDSVNGAADPQPSQDYTQPTNSTPVIKRGPKKLTLVLKVQERLKHHGYYGGHKIDGIFGPLTESAVMQFQRSRRLPETGIVDNATWVELLKE